MKKKKPRLSNKHRREKMLWAQKYQNWTLADWHRVIWSDETKINSLGSDGLKLGLEKTKFGHPRPSYYSNNEIWWWKFNVVGVYDTKGSGGLYKN